MRILLILGLLGVWLGGHQTQKVIKTGLGQLEVHEAIPTQIESPAEVGGDIYRVLCKSWAVSSLSGDILSTSLCVNINEYCVVILPFFLCKF